MGITVEHFSELTVSVYEAALAPATWPSALDDISRAMKATGAALIAGSAGRRLPRCATLPVVALTSYRDYYRVIDYVLDDVESGPIGVVRSGDEVIDPLAGSEFDADWMRPNDIRDGLFVRLTGEAHPVSFLIAAPRRSQPFATAERLQLMTMLVPHLQQALRTQELLSRSAGQVRDLTDSIDAFPSGMVITDAQCRVIHANTAAEALFARADGLTMRDGRLRAAQALADVSLARGVAVAADATGHRVPSGASMVCARSNGLRGYVVHIVPLGPVPTDSSPGHALVIVIDPERDRRPSPLMLQQLYGLTTAEAKVAAAILPGHGLSCVAEELCLSVTTVKTHLQRIYAKTATCRQAELVDLLIGHTLS